VEWFLDHGEHFGNFLSIDQPLWILVGLLSHVREHVESPNLFGSIEFEPMTDEVNHGGFTTWSVQCT
jgi:hypothetical protein